jgi:hypothetical protein
MSNQLTNYQSLNFVGNPTFYSMSKKLGIKEMSADYEITINLSPCLCSYKSYFWGYPFKFYKTYFS